MAGKSFADSPNNQALGKGIGGRNDIAVIAFLFNRLGSTESGKQGAARFLGKFNGNLQQFVRLSHGNRYDVGR